MSWSQPCPQCGCPVDLPDPARTSGRYYRVLCTGPADATTPLDHLIPQTKEGHFALFERAQWVTPGQPVRWVWKRADHASTQH